MSAIAGFDYQAKPPQAVELTRKQWRERIAAAIKLGGRRHFMEGETFVYARTAKCLFEIYGNIQAPKPAEAA